MAKFIRFRNIIFSQTSKTLYFHSIPSSSLPDLDAFQYTRPNYSLSEAIKSKALYTLNSCKTSTQLCQIQAYLITSDLFQDPSFSGRLLNLSTNVSDDFDYTVLIFKCIDFPDSFCVNKVIKHYSCSGYYEKAAAFYIEMLKEGNFTPNSFTFPPLISACAKVGRLNLGKMCHGQAVKLGVDGVLPVQNSLVHLYACCGTMDVAHKLFDEMQFRDLVSWNTIIEGFANEGKMDVAHDVFDEMTDRNIVSWNMMMTGYLKFRNPGNVLQLFRKMMLLEFKSNDTTIVNVITACVRSNRLKEGKSIHGFLIKTYLYSNLIINSTIVHMYGRCGRVDLARLIFNSMPIKNLVSWNAMILGYCIHGNPLDGLSLYSEMLGKNREHSNSRNSIHPDEVTFIGVLCACARKGMLTEGRKYFSHMIDVFHIKPNFAHYWCMANLLAAVGLMQEAVDFLKNISIDIYEFPESSLWSGLLASCRFQGDVTLGERIAKELIEQDSGNFSYYALLVNVYAVAGRWEEVARIKEMMKERGIRQVPGCNLKDLKEIVHHVRLRGKSKEELKMGLMK